jgi:hypothetical protein
MTRREGTTRTPTGQGEALLFKRKVPSLCSVRCLCGGVGGSAAGAMYGVGVRVGLAGGAHGTAVSEAWTGSSRQGDGTRQMQVAVCTKPCA